MIPFPCVKYFFKFLNPCDKDKQPYYTNNIFMNYLKKNF